LIEFERKYSTPLAQKQSELEWLIKFYEMKRASNIRQVCYSFGVGVGFLFLMGFIVDYSRVEGGWVVAGFLSVLTCLSFLFGTGFYAYSQNSRPDLRNPEKFI
jgi:hypothetical protein|tara:strand:+ start:224 stop:532 length:309 start_codon:yes stop_codon:yes gene_type:complete